MPMAIGLFLFLLTTGCSTDSTEPIIEGFDPETNVELAQIEKDALIFMLEEERLAKDVYLRLYEVWGKNQFQNIAQSEQTHMDAVESLLKQYSLPYTILEAGTFQNADLQTAYDTLVTHGQVNLVGAFTSGATIEDLDINDLEEWMAKIENSAVWNVFSKLQCGSRNHLRAFATSLEMEGAQYSPQFISQTLYEQIINDDHERCN